MLWVRFIVLFILFLLGRHSCFPNSPRYLELADSADYYIAKENWGLAESKIMEALRLEPANFSNSMLLSNLGIVQLHKGEYRKAIETFSMGLNIAPSSTVLLNNRAHTYLILDSIEAAQKDIDRSLSIDSIQEWALQSRGYLYLQNNEIESAERIFRKLRNSFPDNDSALYGMAAIAETRNQLEEAKKFYNEALERHPEDEDAREALILLLIKLNDYTAARGEIKKGLSLNPENGVYYLLRGYLHRLNYRHQEAEADKKIAIAKGLDAEYVSGYIP
ncbi:MAG: tetratricopeptide repeat protein [Muribaculaceae bacterium]|nr:tetratricopeptide repeat protein [Muribaculaceae bacterium]